MTTREGSPVEGVDLEILHRWLDDRGIGEGPIEDVEPISGGTQNILVRLRRGDREVVLRRPPLHKRANSDETMRREARVLAAVAGTGVPHPALVAAESDDTVLGAAFYVVEPVAGFNPSLGLPAPFAAPAWQHAMGLSVVDAVAALGSVDHVAVGLADFGRGEGWLERQVGRWRRQLDGYRQFEGYSAPRIPGVDEVGAWLDTHRPSSTVLGIIHGDVHFANVLVRHHEPRLAALVDWELATIGDPLLDLGHLLATWPSGQAAGVGTAASGLPTRTELIDRYAQRTGREMSSIDWFQVLACYRLGLILEGTHARACAGLAPKDIGDALHDHTVRLFEQALGLIG